MICAVVFGGHATAEESTSPSAASAGPGSLSALHADLKFSVATAARATSTETDSPDSLLQNQIARLTPVLENAARGLRGAQMQRIGKFDVYIANATDPEARSSSTGKIAVNAGLSSLALSDDTVAFLLAREMAHVLAGHHEENSTASIITSIVMNILIPGSSLVKSAISVATSEAASSTGQERQIREADELALQLLETAGYRRRDLALSLAADIGQNPDGNSTWARNFRASAGKIANLGKSAAPAQLAQTPLPGSIPPAATVSTNPPVLSAAALPVRTESPIPVLTQSGAPAAVRLPDESFTRARPSGIAGPLLLGGFAVPSRRID